MKRRQQWFEQMRDFILGRESGLTNFNEGARDESLVMATALGLEEESFAADSAYRQLYFATASGAGLDARAGELGLKRKPATKATGFFRFEGVAGTDIPDGTKVATGDPTVDVDVVEYVTTEAGHVEAGETSADVPIEAVVAGAAGTAEAGEIDTLVDTVAGVTGGDNPSRLSGYDEESDPELRRRCALALYRMAVGGPPKYWEALTLDVAGVARASCISGGAGAGTFRMLLWSRNADGDLIPASATLADAVDALLQGYVLPGVLLTVEPAEGVAQDVTLYVDVSSGFEVAAAAVQGAIEDLFPAVTLIVAEISAAAMGVENVTDCRVATPQENVTAAEGTLYAGVIRVLPMEWDGDYTL